MDSPCWIWQGATITKGYPARHPRSGRILVHRQVFIEAGGELAAGQHVHHLCHVKRCVNPAHLAAIDPYDHGREHLEHEPLIDRIVALLCEVGPMSSTEITYRLGEKKTVVAVVLTRGKKQGRVWNDRRYVSRWDVCHGTGAA